MIAKSKCCRVVVIAESKCYRVVVIAKSKCCRVVVIAKSKCCRVVVIISGCGSYCETCHWADNSQTTVVCDECTTNEGITLGALSLACLSKKIIIIISNYI